MRDEMKPNHLTDGMHRAAIHNLCTTLALDPGPEVCVRQPLALRDRPDQQETVRGVTVPTLILGGREEAQCPVPRPDLMRSAGAGIGSAHLDGAGHLPTPGQGGPVTG